MSHIFCRLKIINLYITRSQQWSQEDIECLTTLAADKKIAPNRNQRPYEEGQDTLSTWRTRLPYMLYLPYRAANDGFPSKHGFAALSSLFHLSCSCHFQAGKHWEAHRRGRDKNLGDRTECSKGLVSLNSTFVCHGGVGEWGNCQRAKSLLWERDRHRMRVLLSGWDVALVWRGPVRDVSRKNFTGFTHLTKATSTIKKSIINRIY